jgi:hypothetical protein
MLLITNTASDVTEKQRQDKHRWRDGEEKLSMRSYPVGSTIKPKWDADPGSTKKRLGTTALYRFLTKRYRVREEVHEI